MDDVLSSLLLKWKNKITKLHAISCHSLSFSILPCNRAFILKICRELWLKELSLVAPFVPCDWSKVLSVLSGSVFQTVFVDIQTSLKERYQISLSTCPFFGETWCPQDYWRLWEEGREICLTSASGYPNKFDHVTHFYGAPVSTF